MTSHESQTRGKEINQQRRNITLKKTVLIKRINRPQDRKQTLGYEMKVKEKFNNPALFITSLGKKYSHQDVEKTWLLLF